ncbi:family 4 glycosyl hydrolase [Tengunoibacter tsumagoiensis]|uniref:6-phospho-beta-glucosidase n=1 Tax=Tengunoibacter tsumagoiensis TaxID=2014871 RepID=A0A402A4C8_9CHLR|nr:glycoside hydrolase [Tengunoibacter tsumagoiensis]GCE13861.1 6-phospho-beta-glucosidase [Tengunoibacter tsumagoiensis]
MARIKLAYIGGGSTRGPGTVASLIEQGQNFVGSEIVLIDLNEERLKIVQKIAQKMAAVRGLDLTITITTDRRAGLQGCDAVLTSYRPGNFEARYLDESIPLKYGVIGQETQGPGGFFMALRSIHIMRDIIKDMEEICPDAWLINYTNPINLVSEAVVHHSPIRTVSLCEGPIIYNTNYVRFAELDPDKLDAVSIGLNHGSWTIRHQYDGQDFIPLLQAAYERALSKGQTPRERLRMIELACLMESLPSNYFQYYYFNDEILAEQQAKPTTRAQDILANVEDFWVHYREQSESANPVLDPERSRGGINELELAIDIIDAIFNDRKEVWYVNVPNRGALADLPEDRVVELTGFVDRNGITPLQHGHLPKPVRGLVQQLSEYQSLAAEAAWGGTRKDAIKALASNPLVPSLSKAQSIYDEMAAALRNYLPERLLH